jgi:hypothetical protein
MIALKSLKIFLPLPLVSHKRGEDPRSDDNASEFAATGLAIQGCFPPSATLCFNGIFKKRRWRSLFRVFTADDIV